MSHFVSSNYVLQATVVQGVGLALVFSNFVMAAWAIAWVTLRGVHVTYFSDPPCLSSGVTSLLDVYHSSWNSCPSTGVQQRCHYCLSSPEIRSPSRHGL